jgi:hypothetical protein
VLVYKNPQRQRLAAAEQELAQLLENRAALDRRVAELQQVIESLMPVVRGFEDADEKTNVSLPNLCLRELALSGPKFLSATAIRDGLSKMGVSVAGNNPMAVIHTTLGRLTNDGYAESKRFTLNGPLQFRITRKGVATIQSPWAV